MHPDDLNGMFSYLRRIEERVNETREEIAAANLPQLAEDVRTLRDEQNVGKGAARVWAGVRLTVQTLCCGGLVYVAQWLAPVAHAASSR